MKKLLFISLVVLTISSSIAQNNWCIAVTSGIISNPTKLIGGSPDANSKFVKNRKGGIPLGIIERYFFNNHWSAQSGINLSAIGFDYGLAKDYSLVKNDHYTKNNVNISAFQIPFTGIYAFNPNCRNVRFYVGGGISLMKYVGAHTRTNDITIPTLEKTLTPDYINQTVTVNNAFTASGQFIWGIEKLMKKGGIAQLGFVGNRGFRTIATSDVTYSVSNTTYEHKFSNQGNYLGMTFTYYFRPVKKI